MDEEDDLVTLSRRRRQAILDRDRLIFEEVMAGGTYQEVGKKYRSAVEPHDFLNISGVKQIVVRWAKDGDDETLRQIAGVLARPGGWSRAVDENGRREDAIDRARKIWRESQATDRPEEREPEPPAEPIPAWRRYLKGAAGA